MLTKGAMRDLQFRLFSSATYQPLIIVTDMNKKAKKYKTVLTVAGSDPIGGAGIQADIKTCCSFGVYAMAVISVITAQNTLGVSSSCPVPVHAFEAQLKSVFDDVTPDAVKIGLIPSPEHISVLASILKYYNAKNIIVDPVLRPSSGADFVYSIEDTADTMVSCLLPLASIITPNIPEAEFLTKKFRIPSSDIKRLLKVIGTKALLLKGGHRNDRDCSDIFFIKDKDNPVEFSSPERIISSNTHGTGCALSTAIACGLALGYTMEKSVATAKKYVYNAIKDGRNFEFGKGTGPLYFFNNIYDYESDC